MPLSSSLKISLSLFFRYERFVRGIVPNSGGPKLCISSAGSVETKISGISSIAIFSFWGVEASPAVLIASGISFANIHSPVIASEENHFPTHFK